MSKTYGRDYRKDVELNKFRLDEEAEVQATLVQYWTEELGRAYTTKAEKEVFLKFTEGERALYYKRIPDDQLTALTGLKKLTDETVKQLVASDIEVAKANAELLDAIEELNLLKAAVDAIREKGDMIRHEVSLFIAGYFGDKSKPRQDYNTVE